MFCLLKEIKRNLDVSFRNTHVKYSLRNDAFQGVTPGGQGSVLPISKPHHPRTCVTGCEPNT